MHGEQGLAEMGWRFQVAQDVVEEVVWVGEAGVTGLVVAVVVAGAFAFLRGLRLAVVEDYDFVDAEDGAGSGDLSR